MTDKISRSFDPNYIIWSEKDWEEFSYSDETETYWIAFPNKYIKVAEELIAYNEDEERVSVEIKPEHIYYWNGEIFSEFKPEVDDELRNYDGRSFFYHKGILSREPTWISAHEYNAVKELQDNTKYIITYHSCDEPDTTKLLYVKKHNNTFKIKNDIPPETMKEFKENWNKLISGAKNSWHCPIIETTEPSRIIGRVFLIDKVITAMCSNNVFDGIELSDKFQYWFLNHSKFVKECKIKINGNIVDCKLEPETIYMWDQQKFVRFESQTGDEVWDQHEGGTFYYTDKGWVRKDIYTKQDPYGKLRWLDKEIDYIVDDGNDINDITHNFNRPKSEWSFVVFPDGESKSFERNNIYVWDEVLDEDDKVNFILPADQLTECSLSWRVIKPNEYDAIVVSKGYYQGEDEMRLVFIDGQWEEVDDYLASFPPEQNKKDYVVDDIFWVNDGILLKEYERSNDATEWEKLNRKDVLINGLNGKGTLYTSEYYTQPYTKSNKYEEGDCVTVRTERRYIKNGGEWVDYDWFEKYVLPKAKALRDGMESTLWFGNTGIVGNVECGPECKVEKVEKSDVLKIESKGNVSLASPCPSAKLDILNIKPLKYSFKLKDNSQKQIGLIAQDMGIECPNLREVLKHAIESDGDKLAEDAKIDFGSMVTVRTMNESQEICQICGAELKQIELFTSFTKICPKCEK